MPYTALSQLPDVALPAVLDQVPDALSVFDAEWRYRFVNAAAAELLRRGGIEPASALGRPLWEVVPSLRGTAVEAGLRDARRDGRVITITEQLGPAARWYETRCVPTIGGAVTIVRDVTVVRTAEAAADRTRRLQSLTAALNAARTPQEVADVSLEQGMLALGAQGGGAVLLQPGGTEQALVSLRGMGDDLVADRGWWTFPLSAPYPVNEAVRENRLVFCASGDEFAERYPEVGPAVRDLGFEAYAAAPLEFEGRILGCINYNFRERRDFSDADVAFMIAVARQCAQALERARLYDAVARSHDEARAAERRARLLAEASDLLAAVADTEAALARVARLVVPDVSDWCAVDLLEEGGAIRRVAVVHRDPERQRWAEQVQESMPPRLDDPGGIGLVVRTGEPLFAPEIPPGLVEALAPSTGHRDVWRAMDVRSAITVPLRARGRTFGALTFMQSESGRRFAADDLELATEIARRAALAIDAARLLAAAERARRDAEAASHAKTEFLAVMSHELRTPLNAIAGYAELLEMELHGPVTDAQREALARIQRSQRHLLGLINDVLNFAKLETGAVRYEIRELPVLELLDGVEALVAPQLAAKQLRLTVDGRDAALVVRADAEKVRQVLLNLLSNAAKFTPPGGSVAVSAVRARGQVALRVRDTGVGIAPEHLGRIFEPFVQLHRTLSSPRDGAGLGLAISRDLARGMGGDLRVESTLHQGTIFSLLLPAAGAPAGRAAARPAPTAR